MTIQDGKLRPRPKTLYRPRLLHQTARSEKFPFASMHVRPPVLLFFPAEDKLTSRQKARVRKRVEKALVSQKAAEEAEHKKL